MTAINEIPIEVDQAFTVFCKENGWTKSEVLTLAMLECIKEDTDLVVKVLKQRQARRDVVKWFTRLPFWPLIDQNSE